MTAVDERLTPEAVSLPDQRTAAAEAALAAYVDRVVAAAPPLTKEQRTRVAALLTPTPGRADE